MSGLRVFVGFSTENAELALKVAALIDKCGGQAKRWSDNLFPPGVYIWDTLKELSKQFDGAIFLFGCEDKVQSRDKDVYQARDNVLLEFGLFSGSLPRQAVALYRVGESKTAVDLGGLTYIDDRGGEFGAAAELGVSAWFSGLEKFYKDFAKAEAEKAKAKRVDSGITSIFPTIELKTDDQKVVRVHRYSSSCREFYGYADYVDLSDKPVQELVSNLQPFVDPPGSHWDDFQQDQIKVMEKYTGGKLPLAQVPIHFNVDHPYYPYRTFVPLIVERSIGAAGDLSRILYLDVAKLPKGVFGAPVWAELSKNIDTKKLSVELGQIAENWKIAVPGVAAEREKALRDAAEEAAGGGSMKVVTLCGEAGFYAVRQFAQKGAYPNAQLFLRRVLALTEDPASFNG
jgi:hypothetical protein